MKKSSPAKYMNLSSYLNQYKKLDPSSFSKSVKIAHLASYTTRGLKECIAVKCAEFSLRGEVYDAPYNQIQQEVLDPQSDLYAFMPDIIFLLLDTKALLGEHSSVNKEFIDEKFREILSLKNMMQEHSKALIILHTFEVPTYSAFGIQENKQLYGLHEAIQELNAKLRDSLKSDPRAFLFDYDGFLAKIGKGCAFDPKMYYLADMKLDFEYLPELADCYLAYILPCAQMNRKCLVLDLDQTLWGGIVGEDGMNKIELGPTAEGRPFWEFQKEILALYDRGIILAVNSLNNFEDAIKAIREHPYMLLREKHFAAMKINWNDKVSNMKALAEELNLTLDSFVFVDNDKMQREMVKKMLPEVYVVDLPEDPALYVQELCKLPVFNTLQLTNEDRRRGEHYAAKRHIASLPEYLASLEQEISIEPANEQTITRIAQLTQKTNQFNMSTKRYSEEDIKKMALSDAFLVYSVHVRDKFADHGIVGVMIVEKGQKAWRLDTFLLSCRVIGRQIEHKMLTFMKAQSSKELIFECIPTEKNKPAQDFFKK